MESTATTVRVNQASPVQTASTRSINATHPLVKMEQPASTRTTNTNATALMAIKASSVRRSSIGVHKVHVRTVQRVFSRRTSSDATVLLVGQEKCAMLRWCLVKMRPFVKKSIPKFCATMELVRTSETPTNVTASKVTPDHIVRRRSTNVNQPRV